MPYADPEQQRAHQRDTHRDRSRGVAIYRAALVWCANSQTSEGNRLLGRLTRMLTAELLWRRTRDIPLPRWPAQREEELIRLAPPRAKNINEKG